MALFNDSSGLFAVTQARGLHTSGESVTSARVSVTGRVDLTIMTIGFDRREAVGRDDVI